MALCLNLLNAWQCGVLSILDKGVEYLTLITIVINLPIS